MATQQNQAAWLEGKGAQLRVGPAEMPKPGSDEVLIRNYAAAVNPIDWKIQSMGLMVEKFPAVIGFDVAGEVIEVGDGVTRFKKGDRVIAGLDSPSTNDARQGAYQLYSVAPVRVTAKLPDSIPYTTGVVFPIAFNTAMTGLCRLDGNGLGLPVPSLNPAPTGKTIVVWGGSSSVGTMVTQVAVAAGVQVVTCARPHNFALCKTCGATEVLDYRSETIVTDLITAVRKTGGVFAGVFDTISSPEGSFKYTMDIVDKLGGGTLVTIVPGVPEAPKGVNAIMIHGGGPTVWPLWKTFVTPALEAGKIKCLPEPYVIGKGLDSVQKGLDENKKGVSGRKVVMEL